MREGSGKTRSIPPDIPERQTSDPSSGLDVPPKTVRRHTKGAESRERILEACQESTGVPVKHQPKSSITGVGRLGIEPRTRGLKDDSESLCHLPDSAK